MEPIQIALYIGISIVMLIFAFFLSASEISFVSIPSQRVSHLLRIKAKNAEILEYFKDNYHRTLILVLSGQLISVITATTLLTAVAKETVGVLGITAIDIGMTISALIFVQIIPKKYGIENEKFALYYAPTLKKISKIMYPVIWFFDKETTLLFKILKIKKEKARTIEEGELESLLKQTQMNISIRPEEKKMIENALAFNDVTVAEPMIPIVHAESLNINSDENKISEILTNAKSGFIIVYDNNNIKGILNVKEGLKCMIKINELSESQKSINVSLKESLKEILIAPYFVGKDKKVGVVFKEMKEKRLKFAFVVNEDKKVKGIIKLEDMFEEIVGEV